METASSASGIPERPPGVPAHGTWNDRIAKWEAVAASGSPDGECLRFRPDGTLFSRSRFSGGVEEGPFVVYHPNGTVAREGRYVAGRIEGVMSSYAPTGGDGEPLRPCCVPPGATRLDRRFREGSIILETFFDGEGRALCADGSLRPPLPPSLPDLVELEEPRGLWAWRSPTLDRFWTVDGVLCEEEERTPGDVRISRRYDASGALAEVSAVDAERRRTGAYLRRLAPDAPAAYADARIREERGTFEAGQAVGEWIFLAEDGAVVRTIDRGRAVSTASLESSPAFAPALGDGWALARDLAAEGCVREALCAAARAAVRSVASSGAARAREQLMAFLDAHVVACTPDVARERGDALANDATADVPAVLDGLVCGADPASVFRVLGATWPGSIVALVEVVEASLLLAPERSTTHITRALVRAQHGDEAGARADAQIVAVDSPSAAESLTSYLDVVFRPYELPTWWDELVVEPADAAADPEAEVRTDSDAGEVPLVGQSLEAIQHLTELYATRIGQLREAIFALGAEATVVGASPCDPGAAWLPPDLSALLPEGPIALDHQIVPCDPDPAGGPPETIEIDERIVTNGLRVPGLLAQAQADYQALAWLCWSTGLRAIARPTAIEPPATLVAGMRAIVQRHWRADDRTRTGGLVALGKGIPGFEWRGIAVDDMPPHVLSVVLGELLAARSMFLWLLSPDTMSPFQDDIRDA